MEAPAKVNLAEKLAQIHDHFKQRIVGELNGQQVKLVKVLGPFIWHHHETEDEIFLVVRGRFRMEFRDRHVWVEEGEFLIVPHGVEHRPVADEEVSILLFEPASTVNTGNVVNELTTAELPRL
ncbi:MAG TPA: cupin domain-containing protein [Thermoanaerobaculia bacterium]